MLTPLVLFCIFGAVVSQFPPVGLYVTLRNDALLSIAESVSLQISDAANTYLSTPDQTGSNSEVAYVLSSFIYDINLQNPTISTTGATEFTLIWDSLEFVITFDYLICVNVWPNPCENGQIQIFAASSVLEVDCTLSFNGPTISFTAQSVEWNVYPTNFVVDVQCFDAFFNIQTGDIQSGVTNAFQGAIQQAIQGIASSIGTQYLDTIATTISIPDLNIDIDLAGGFALLPGTNPNLCIYSQGVFTPDGTQQPPFSPTFVPPSSVFNSPANQLDFLFTEYMIQSAIWALNLKGYFNQTVVSADIPPSSPIQLNTDNIFFKQAVPELEHYPHMNITLKTALVNVSDVELSKANGASIVNTLWIDFFLVNTSAHIYGWTLIVDIGAALKFDAMMSGKDIEVQVTPSNPKASCQVLKSHLGDVSVHDFNVLFGLALQVIGTNSHSFVIPTPSYFNVTAPVITINDGYADIGSGISYFIDFPINVCSSDVVCPFANTCCNWSGSWGCCILPSAVCCPVGCCPPGSYCTGDGCAPLDANSNQTFTHVF